MSFYDIYNKYKDLPFEKLFRDVISADVEKAVATRSLDENNFLALLSLEAGNHLEALAGKAHNLTLKHFGRVVALYTPMYLSNYCENQCVYCGFNSENKVERKKLSFTEVENEAAFIAATGLKHILILTGDSREMSPLSYIRDCVRIMKKYFSSISIEIYALDESEYAQLAEEGVDGLTIYQETYDQKIYGSTHKAGPKKDYLFRLAASERGAKNGIRNINIGVLLGLNDWRKEVFFMGLHAKYLQDKFFDLDFGVSIPRLRPHAGDFKISCPVSDSDMVQIITALRIFLPRLNISLSTRESAQFRENILPLGITRMSAGSSTSVGGHTLRSDAASSLPQFEIDDTRDVKEVAAMLEVRGYQPVYKDWMLI